MLRRHIFLVTAAMVLIFLMVGCDDLSSDHKGPRYLYHSFQTSCKGVLTDYGGIISGVESNLVVVFATENVYQGFDSNMTLTSSSISPGDSPAVHPLATFHVSKRDPGKATGEMQAVFVVYPQCSAEGDYLLNVVITDSHGKYAVVQGSVRQLQTPSSGSEDCACVWQCGGCRVFASHGERCNCGCKFYNEQCKVTDQ